jgi:hypothetical protein
MMFYMATGRATEPRNVLALNGFVNFNSFDTL